MCSLRVFPKIIAISFLLVVSACGDNPASDSLAELELIYINSGIYDPVACDKEEVEGDWFIFCHAVGSGQGGLFRVDSSASEEKRQVLQTVNGKARQHLGAAGIDLQCGDGSQPQAVPAKLVDGVIVFACSNGTHDIPSILKMF